MKAAAKARAAKAAAVAQLQAEGYAPSVDPIRELLSLGAEVTALKNVLRNRVAQLTDEEWAYENRIEDEDVRAVVSAYERALDRCERTLTNMLKLDLEQRQQKFAEENAAAIVRVLQGAVRELGIEDHPDLGVVIRRQLSAEATQ